MTKRLYSENPYKQSFDAIVEKVQGEKVWLNQTCFFPRSGGQVGDMGALNNLKVIDTEFDSEKNIVHVLECISGLEIGDRVEGQINWDRRHKIMCIHSASHIMEHFLFQVFGDLKLIGSHLNEKYDKSTYVSEERFNSEELKKVEDRANEFIAQGLPIETWTDEKKLYFKYWKCGPIEMPCGGTHPRNTDEIGKIKLKRENGGKGCEKVVTSLV